ncbi:Cystatin-B-like [Homarus americanus]|uniref:Cystatin-B-like n=1 Tax=Homarus americanus TaxID=6706 RepID=A0A8J5K6D0_HOMAM|nr:Cystatin-B-like [Homarus americanus]
MRGICISWKVVPKTESVVLLKLTSSCDVIGNNHQSVLARVWCRLYSLLRSQVEDKLGREVSQFTLLSYKTQVVAGTNYFAKVDIGEEEVVHMRVYKDLKQNLSLHSIQHPKAKEDDIAYF